MNLDDPLDASRPSWKLYNKLLALGVTVDEASELLNGYAHELAERVRRHPVYSDSKATWHRHTLYGFVGESFKAQEELDALTEAIVDSLAKSIDPKAKP